MTSLSLVPTTTVAPAPLHDDPMPVIRRGFAVLLLGLGGFLAFAAWAPVDQALPGSGLVGVASQRKAVQPVAGGSVLSLAVREGDAVQAGQVLLTLDTTAARAELLSARRQALLLAATHERLAALLAGEASWRGSAALEAQAAAVDGGAALLATQRQLFGSQRQGREQSVTELQARAAQLRSELSTQRQTLDQQREQQRIVQEQTAQLEALTQQGFYPRLRLGDAQRQLNGVQQDVSRTEGEVQRVQAALAQAGAAQALRGSEQRRDWEAEMLEVDRQAALVGARVVALQQQIAQSQLTAPVAGTVVGLAVHTVGGVVQGGQTLMEIVPRDDRLVVEARFALAAGEKLVAGQPADLHFTTMDRSRTPVLTGEVLTVSADKLDDTRSGQPYLRVRVAVPEGERAKLRAAGVELRAGLPVDVMVRLGERSLLGYLLKPLGDRLSKSMTE